MAGKHEHARAALRRTASGIESLRARSRGRAWRAEDRIIAEIALRDLLARQQQLVELHDLIERATGLEAERLWKRFFECYEAFLQALEGAREQDADTVERDGLREREGRRGGGRAEALR